jgi:RNase P/RNase MRP subunit POP5
MRISLVLGSGKVKASQELFTQALDAAVTGLYGIIGGAFNWDLVEFDEDNGVATIVSQKSSEQRIWAAAGFMTQFKGSPCRLQVLESSSTLFPVTSLDPELAEPYTQTTKNA